MSSPIRAILGRWLNSHPTLLSGARMARALQRHPGSFISGRVNRGLCSICAGRTLFVEESAWLRDCYRCVRCRSIPRWRATIIVLDQFFPAWRNLSIYEPAPGGPSSAKIAAECQDYISSHYIPDARLGHVVDGIRCEDLEALTFQDRMFDVVVSQDVLEHVLDPSRAFAEIGRVLKPGGAHVFTVPFLSDRPTVVRAIRASDGIEYVKDAAYHANPVDPKGSLVVTDWGYDLIDAVHSASGMNTAIYHRTDRRLGLDGAHLEVFVSRKPPASTHFPS